MTKVRIAIAAEWLRASGGVTQSLLRLLDDLDPQDAEVTLFLMRDSGECRDLIPKHVRVIEDAAEVVYLPPKMACSSVRKTHGMIASIKLACLIILGRITNRRTSRFVYHAELLGVQNEHFDVSASYAMLDSFSNFYAQECLTSSRKVMWCHTHPDLYPKELVKSLGILLEKYDRINCVGQTSRDALQVLHPQLADKLAVFHNLVDETRIWTLAQEDTHLRISPNLNICTVARVSREKGIDLAVEAAHKLAQHGIDFTWWVVGPMFDENFGTDIRDLAKAYGLTDRVVFLGHQQNPYPYMALCDIYVQPSRVEGYCGTTVEAKILKKPVIRTSTPDAYEQFTHDVDGSIVPISAEALCAEILRLHDDRTIGERYEVAASVEKVAQKSAITAFT